MAENKLRNFKHMSVSFFILSIIYTPVGKCLEIQMTQELI